MLSEIMMAIRYEKRALARYVTVPHGGDPSEVVRAWDSFRPEQIEQMLRVEIEQAAWEELYGDLHRDREAGGLMTMMAHKTGRREGPFRIEGVAVYEVTKLPAPGWRVVNPMVI